MPHGDCTGPMGQGPMTGRALGFSTGYDSPGNTKGFGGGEGMSRGFGFGRGRGFRGGWGFGRSRNFGLPDTGYFPGSPSLSKADEMKMLKAQAHSLKRSQSDIEKRLKELEDEESEN